MLNQAIMESMKAQQNGLNPVNQEPMNPEQRKREDNVPVGLKNLGNTCYFNSILQVYFNIPEFACAILEFQDDDFPLPPLRFGLD
jgi:ubiquitin carboxyl-terminal hydrolase 25